LAALAVFSACDNWNIPVKDQMEFYASVTPVSSWAELRAQAENSDHALLALAHDVVPDSTITVTRPLTITAFEGTRIISRGQVDATAFKDQMFWVSGAGNLTLGHPQGGTLILDGGSNDGVTATSPLVEVQRAHLTIRDGAILRNNNNSSGTGGGGVFVNADSSSSATLTMSGGVISGNTATGGGGGGVYVWAWSGSASAEMTMSGGVISGNTATGGGGGGGVYVLGDSGSAEMRMNGGTISGNTADTYGGGVCVDSYGQFIKSSGGVIYGGTEPYPLRNTASVDGRGHVAYVYDGPKYRDTTVPEGQSLNSSEPGGWEP
jgi:hypothetical protein